MIILAFDLGASSYRAVVAEIDETEKRVKLLNTYRWSNQIIRVGENLYWDLLKIWDDMKKTIKSVYRIYGERLYSVGVDSWGVDFVLLDSTGELIGLPHAYRDPRTIEAVEKISEKISREELYRLTGIQFMRINTIYHLYAMRLRNDPKLSVANRFLMIPDLFHYWLSKLDLVEYTNASTTQLLDPWRKKWLFELIERLDLPKHIFPEIFEAGDLKQDLRKDLVDELEIREQIQVVPPATHDTASAVAAAPMISEDVAYISSGTWSLIGVEIKQPIINELGYRYNFTNEGGVFGTIRFLKNVQGMWIIEEIRRVVKEESGNELTYEEISKLISSTERPRVFIDPDHENFISPQNMVEAIRNYLKKTDQDYTVGLGEIIVGVYYSLAMKYRYVIELIERLVGKRINAINIIGGGARNSELNQLISDISRRRVYAGPYEATSIGNILMQAKGLDVIKSLNELREYVRNSVEINVFEIRKEGEYEDLYDKFLKKLNLEK
jgi:sugar (pentulose or hexulose) kinase